MLAALSTLSVDKAGDVSDSSYIQQQQRKRNWVGRTVQNLPGSAQSSGDKSSRLGLKYLTIPTDIRQSNHKSTSDFKVGVSVPETKNLTAGNDDPEDADGLSYDVDRYFKTIKNSKMSEQLLSGQLSGMSATDFDQVIEEFIREIEASSGDQAEVGPLSIQ